MSFSGFRPFYTNRISKKKNFFFEYFFLILYIKFLFVRSFVSAFVRACVWCKNRKNKRKWIYFVSGLKKKEKKNFILTGMNEI